MSVIFLYAKEGKLQELQQYLDKHPAELNIQNEGGYTLLMLACEQGHIEIVRWLLAQPNCKVDTVSYSGYVYYIDEGYNLERSLVFGTPTPDGFLVYDDVKGAGYTALMLAARNRHIDIVELLLTLGKADPHQLVQGTHHASWGEVPYHYTAASRIEKTLYKNDGMGPDLHFIPSEIEKLEMIRDRLRSGIKSSNLQKAKSISVTASTPCLSTPCSSNAKKPEPPLLYSFQSNSNQAPPVISENSASSSEPDIAVTLAKKLTSMIGDLEDNTLIEVKVPYCGKKGEYPAELYCPLGRLNRLKLADFNLKKEDIISDNLGYRGGVLQIIIKTPEAFEAFKAVCLKHKTLEDLSREAHMFFAMYFRKIKHR